MIAGRAAVDLCSRLVDLGAAPVARDSHEDVDASPPGRGAGWAAHLAGVIASKTTLPVIGVPIDSSPLKGVDALYATVQMPPGVPVATMAVGKAGAKNAGIFAAQIIASSDRKVERLLKDFKRSMAAEVKRKSRVKI